MSPTHIPAGSRGRAAERRRHPALMLVALAAAVAATAASAQPTAGSPPLHFLPGTYEPVPGSEPREFVCQRMRVHFDPDPPGERVVLGARLAVLTRHPGPDEPGDGSGPRRCRGSVSVEMRSDERQTAVRNILTETCGSEERTLEGSYVFRGPTIELRLEERAGGRRVYAAACVLRRTGPLAR